MFTIHPYRETGFFLLAFFNCLPCFVFVGHIKAILVGIFRQKQIMTIILVNRMPDSDCEDKTY